MAAIAHALRINTTNQTTTSDPYVDATNGDIAAGNFTTGKKYLILAAAQLGIATSSVVCGVRVVHGATAFADSEHLFATPTSNFRTAYFWWTVWTAVSGEDINLQYAADTSGNTAGLNQILLAAICLSDDLTENTDWKYAEVGTDDALTASFLDGGSVTIVPGTAGHDWLVLTNAQFNMSSSSQSFITRVSRSGEASSLLPEARREESIHAPTRWQASLARVFTLGAASNTFKEQAARTAASVTRLHSRVLALDLNKFRNHGFVYTEADIELSATNYATLMQSLSITPDVTGNVWAGGYFGFDAGAADRQLEFRMHRWTVVKAVDGVDDPAGQTTANYQFEGGNDATDEMPVITQAFPSLTAATAYTFDLDGSADATTGTPAAQHRTMWAVTMELAAAAQGAGHLLSRDRNRLVVN